MEPDEKRDAQARQGAHAASTGAQPQSPAAPTRAPRLGIGKGRIPTPPVAGSAPGTWRPVSGDVDPAVTGSIQVYDDIFGAGAAAASTEAIPAITDPGEAPVKRDDDGPRFDPTRPVMIGTGALLAVGLIFGLWGTIAPIRAYLNSGDTVALPSPQASGSATASAPATVAPKIQAVAAIDPEGDNNEHPEDSDLMFDGKPDTEWMSRFYRNPSFGFKSGIGVAIQLQAPAQVSGIKLDSSATGGEIEVRATTAEKPKEGEVLVKGTFDGGELKFAQPVTTDSLVLWITTLPRDTTGRNRAVIRELSVQ